MQVKLLIFVAAISASLLPATAALSETFSVSALTWVQPQQTVLDTKITKPVISVGGQITRTDQLPTLRLQKLRKILVAKGFVGAVQLRELADAGDSLASLKLAQRMETRDSFQEKSDAIHYYTKAVLWGRTYAALPLLNLLKSIATTKLQPSRLAEAEKALLVAAKQVGKPFIDSLLAVYQAGIIFKGGEEAGERLLRQLANAGDASAALKLVTMLISKKPQAPQDEMLALLKVAQQSDEPGLKATAETYVQLLAALPPQNLADVEGQNP